MAEYSLSEGSQLFNDSVKKVYNRIDPWNKLRIIFSLENGASKMSLAKEYCIHPQAIVYVYNQKESLLQTYGQSYDFVKEACSLNLDQILVEWLGNQIKLGKIVTETNLCEKALELLNTSRDEFSALNEWILDFRSRHSIAKFTLDIKHSPQAKEEWASLHTNVNIKDLYIGSFCTLLYSLELEHFIQGQESHEYVSLMYIVNCTGTDKKQLLLAGRETLDPTVRSLSLQYQRTRDSCLNYTAINNYLSKWNDILQSTGQQVLLAMHIPDDMIDKLCLSNIEIISSINMDYITTNAEMITECFKFHYRRLLISKQMFYGETLAPAKFTDYTHLISLAWHHVPSYYVQCLFFPPEKDSLYYNIGDDVVENNSLSEWCKIYNIPIDQFHSNKLDMYISCDRHLQSINFNLDQNGDGESEEQLQENMKLQPVSSEEAYQAMKRLVCYFQGETAGVLELNAAKNMENYTEYCFLSNLHCLVTSSINDNNEESE